MAKKIKCSSSHRDFGESCLSPASESFHSERFLGDREVHVQSRSRKGQSRVGGIVLNMSISGLNQRKSRDLEQPLLAELCFFPACKDSTCFRSSVLSQNILCPLWLFSVPPLSSLSTKGAGKAFRLMQWPLLLSSPFHVRVKAEASPCSVLAPRLLQSRPFMLPLIFLQWSLWVCALTTPTQVIILFVCVHALTHTHVLPSVFIGVLLGTWLVITLIYSASQQIAFCSVSGITVGAGVHEEPDRKGPFLLGAEISPGR